MGLGGGMVKRDWNKYGQYWNASPSQINELIRLVNVYVTSDCEIYTPTLEIIEKFKTSQSMWISDLIEHGQLYRDAVNLIVASVIRSSVFNTPAHCLEGGYEFNKHYWFQSRESKIIIDCIRGAMMEHKSQCDMTMVMNCIFENELITPQMFMHDKYKVLNDCIVKQFAIAKHLLTKEEIEETVSHIYYMMLKHEQSTFDHDDVALEHHCFFIDLPQLLHSLQFVNDGNKDEASTMINSICKHAFNNHLILADINVNDAINSSKLNEWIKHNMFHGSITSLLNFCHEKEFSPNMITFAENKWKNRNVEETMSCSKMLQTYPFQDLNEKSFQSQTMIRHIVDELFPPSLEIYIIYIIYMICVIYIIYIIYMIRVIYIIYIIDII